jgi:uncharacterized Zn-binding protein involved in type VI secretion
MSKPAARQGDPHTCPLSDGLKPHAGGKITNGSLKVMIAGQAAATVDSNCRCESTLVNAVTSGSSKVQISGSPAARQGDATVHGGVITGGCGRVRIG